MFISLTLICCSVGKRVVHPIHSFQPIKVKLASVVSRAIIAISAQLVKTVITSGKDLNERAKVDVCGSLTYKTRTSTNINDTRKVLEKVQSTDELELVRKINGNVCFSAFMLCNPGCMVL